MINLNSVHLVGRLGKDPEGRTTSSGMSVAGLSIATTSTNSNKEKITEWHRVKAFKHNADFAIKYLKKGDLVFVDGSLRTNKWEKDGITRYTTEIMAFKLSAESKSDGNTQQGDSYSQQPEQNQQQGNNKYSQQSNPNQQQSNHNQNNDLGDFDDDIPF